MKHSPEDVQAALLHLAIDTLARAPEPHSNDLLDYVHSLVTANAHDVAARLNAPSNPA